MALYFYNRNDLYPTARDSYVSYNNSMVIPYMYDGEIWDHTNGMQLQFKYSYSYQLGVNIISPTSVRVYGTTGTYADGYRRGYPGVVTRTSPIAGMTPIEKTTISGKYRMRPTTTSYSYGFMTIKIDFSLDNVVYKYFAFTTGKTSEYVAGYREEYPGNDYQAIALYDADLNPLHISGSQSSQYNNKVIDFGVLPQEVPLFFKEWIDANYIYIYPYTYTVKSPEGAELLVKSEMPPIRKISLGYIGNTVTVTFEGTNDVEYTASYTHTTPVGQVFLGWAYSQDDRRASVQAGQSTPVTWDSDITVYDVFSRYVPPATTFDITLYNNTGENNRVDKTDYLSPIGTIHGALRDECSIITPSIIIQQSEVPAFNYVYIDIFGRYYFVTGVTSVSYGLWRIDLKADVLMSYLEGVKSLTAIIDRQENDYNDELVDNMIPTEKGVDVTITELTSMSVTPVFNNNLDDTVPCYAFVVVGRGVGTDV